MKNVLLISPNSTEKLNESRYVSPAPGVVRLAGYLNTHGHYAEYFDPNLNYLYKDEVSLKDKLTERKWDIIGVSTLEETIKNDIQNLWLASEIVPHALFIAGGIEAQYNYQTLLDKSPCTVIIIGEGEIPLLMLCNDYTWQDIPGIVFKNKSNPLSKQQFENASLCINWKDIPFEKYWNYYINKYGDTITEEIKDQIYTVRVYSKNRCPFKCKFCTSTNQLPDASLKKISSYKWM